MRDNNIDPEKLSRELTELSDKCGVPDYALRGIRPIHTGMLRDVVTPDKEYVVSKISQLNVFKKMCRSDEENLCVFSGDRFPTFSRYAAILMAAQRIQLGSLSSKYFKWISLRYGTRQEEIDNYSSLNYQMVVIDAVYENSSSLTIEKVRELIQKFDAPTTIITGAGMCPSALAHNIIHIDPTRWLRFA